MRGMPSQSARSQSQQWQAVLYVKYKGIRFKRCTACHDDVHAGKFGNRCEQCHSTRGWSTVNRSRFDHSKTRFPLKGRHATVDCRKCHTSGNFLKRLAFQNCSDCHVDEHRGQFAWREDGGRCDACHTEDGFLPALFTIRDHQETRFALAGAHLAVPCVSCHKLVTGSDGRAYRQFRIDRRACKNCHDDVHKGQFRAQVQEHGCAYCHTTESWEQVRFNHDRSRFPLTGQHRQVACEQCHKPVDVGTPMERILFKPIETTCQTCHQDPHMGQFSRLKPVKTCETCHRTDGWEKLDFEHNRDSRFKLENAHAKVECVGCHKPVRRQGVTFILYRPIDPKCSTCH
ncbi:MAG: cytochrome c3 family protein [candidate division KSB1 bacterium]|nr:cytochrome c3 family protein [candidate division KSB1 bacterium]